MFLGPMTLSYANSCLYMLLAHLCSLDGPTDASLDFKCTRLDETVNTKSCTFTSAQFRVESFVTDPISLTWFIHARTPSQLGQQPPLSHLQLDAPRILVGDSTF